MLSDAPSSKHSRETEWHARCKRAGSMLPKLVVALPLCLTLLLPASARASSEGDAIGDVATGLKVWFGIWLGLAAGSLAGTVVLSGVTAYDAISEEQHDQDLITASYAVGGVWIATGGIIAAATLRDETHTNTPLYVAGTLAGVGALTVAIGAASALTTSASSTLSVVPSLNIDRRGDLAPGLSIAFEM